MNRASVPRNPALEHLEADQPAARARPLLREQRLPADERFLVPADRPAEPRLDQGGRLVHVLTVQTHSRLQPERVASAEPCRAQAVSAAGVEQGRPDRRGLLRRHEQLEAVLAGIARPRDRRAYAGHLSARERVVLDGVELDRREELQYRHGPRSLQGDQRVAAARGDGHRVARRPDLPADPGDVLGDVGGVDDQQIVPGGELVDEQVVDDSALGRGQRGVLRAPRLELPGVVRRDALHGRERVVAGDLHLAHVADVEEPGRGAHRLMLLGDAGVLNRHVPPSEGGHPRPHGAVPGVQGGGLQRIGRGAGHRCDAGSPVSDALRRPRRRRSR